MPVITKVVLDGTLFAECEMHGANRDGMMRLTEDITERLVLKNNLDLSFASTVYIEKYDRALKEFINKNYEGYSNKIFSKKPPALSNLLKWKRLFGRKLSKIPISPYYDEIDNCDLFHSFYHPFTNGVLKNNIKRSITYLDIIPLKFNGYPDSLINRTKDIVNSIASNHAISISEFSKNDLLNYDKRIKPENVYVAPLAASKTLFYKNNSKEDWTHVKAKYSLPENYFLCVAGSDIRKNIPHIIQSFNKFLLQEKPKDIHLVLTGNGSHNLSMLNDLNISNEVKSKIFIPNKFIDSDDLAVLYTNAKCFFFMSLYEGFGLPALEAMQCGTPTVVSNTTSLPEVVGEGGILLPPTDIDALCETMNNMYKDESLRNKYAKAGLKKASTFSWQRCADEYADIFTKIITNTSK